MNNLVSLFPSWPETLVWTLVHSLWQALAIASLIVLAMRLIPLKYSRLRYAIACGGMLLLLCASLVTFALLSRHAGPASTRSSFVWQSSGAIALEASEILTLPQGVLELVSRFIQENNDLILTVWAVGALMFSLRLLSGWWYIRGLCKGATVISGLWSDKLIQVARELSIQRTVTLAESVRIHAPVVVGFLKPMVIIPIGMCSGLSTEQVEAIFIHELAHIRRHDYLVNLVQSFLEAVYFFNPFVWIMSSIIRREREYCCDDAVVTANRRSLPYAQALTRLEEERLSPTGFALSLAENKNLLFNRIKRLMEKSARNYVTWDRIVPALLIVIGLVCASWLTLEANERRGHEPTTENEPLAATVNQDTTRKEKKANKEGKSAHYSRKSVTTYDEKGQPHEEIVENFEGDEELRPLLEKDFDTDPGLSPAFNLPLPMIPDIDELMAPFHQFGPRLDSLPAPRTPHDWEAFREEFESKFKDQFGDFFESHKEDLDKMMEEMEESFGSRFGYDQAPFNFDWHLDLQGLEDLKLDDLKELELQARRMDEMMQQFGRAHQGTFDQLNHRLQDTQRRLLESQRGMELKMKDFKEALKDQMVHDGYLDEGDDVDRIEWSDEKIEINNKPIKPEDREKYNQIRNRYFGGGYFQYVE